MTPKYDFSNISGEIDFTLPRKGFTDKQKESKDITIKSTSNKTADISPIILKETESTRLLFYPKWVDPSQTDKPLRGGFRWERKGINDNWQSYKGLSVTKLRKGEFYDLNLDGEAMKNLFEHLPLIRETLNENGIKFGTTTISIGEGNIESVLLQIGDIKNKEMVITKLRDLGKGNIRVLENIILLAKLQNAINTIAKNMNNNQKENFWQAFFTENQWIFESLFYCPVCYLNGETYLGGKNSRGRNGQGGVAADFLLQNLSNKSFAVIEIKTPQSAIIGHQYRGNSDAVGENVCYSMSDELSGAIVQLENQIRIASDNFSTLIGKDYEDNRLNALDPLGIIIIGNKSGLLEEQERSFNLFRKSVSRNIIITFDEIMKRLQLLLNINNND